MNATSARTLKSRLKKARVLRNLHRVIAIVNKAYPDWLVGLYYREPDAAHSDTLAKFIVDEICGTFPDKADDSFLDQLDATISALNNARREMDSVIAALRVAALKHQERTS